MREREARYLLSGRFYHGAYYLLGYAVECALKACVTRQIRQDSFPDKKFVNALYTHDLNELLGLAILPRDRPQRGTALEVNWTTTTGWSEKARYYPTITEVEAQELFEAVTDPNDGVLPWLRTHW
jgi:HEPN domain-containing protein